MYALRMSVVNKQATYLLNSEEGHSRSSEFLFEAPQLLMAYCPACGRLPAWNATHVSSGLRSLVANHLSRCIWRETSLALHAR